MLQYAGRPRQHAVILSQTQQSDLKGRSIKGGKRSKQEEEAPEEAMGWC